MSDTTLDNGTAQDRRRSVKSLAAALAAHAVLIAALALGVGIRGGAPAIPPVTIDLLSSAAPGIGEPGRAGAAGGLPAGGLDSAPAAGPDASAGPIAAAGASPASDAEKFVIPTPRGTPVESPTAAAGPSFRQAGGKTGAAQSMSSVPAAVPAPVVPPVQQRKNGSSSAVDQGAGSVQRSGRGVAVTESSQAASGGPLDLGTLDKALARGGAGGAAGGGAAASGSGGTAAAGSGGSASGSGGGGGGGGSNPTANGTGSGQGYSVGWETPEEGKGRTLLFTALPKLPAWVGKQGLSLSATVEFTVLPNGIIGAVTVRRSSGYADVDSAIIDAVRIWRFSPAPGAAVARGYVPYTTR